MTFPAQLISYYTSQQSQTVAFNRFNTSTNVGVGTTFFTVPEGVTLLSAVCIGGGGGGSGAAGAGDLRGSAGGGGGGLRWSVFTVQPGDILQISVGYGGLAGAASSTATGNGGDGNTSSIEMYQRGSTLVEEPIINAIGGLGGKKSTTDNGSGTAGVGGTGNVYTFTPVGVGTFRTILSGGGSGGAGGASTTFGCGGGGAAGYTGNGGNGGSSATIGVGDPTGAAANSGGGGGGGGRTALGFGGGGVGAFGFDGTTAGIAGTNGTSGGGGGSFFNDPGYPINASLIADVESITTTLNYPPGLIQNDFLLLLSGTDSTTDGFGSGITQLAVPTGFTTISISTNGVYNLSSSNPTILEIIPSNITSNPTRDLNFASSFKYVPEGGLSGTLTGLSTSSIHNLIALRYIPGDSSSPASLIWANESGDPGTNAGGATLMPNPPSVGPIPSGAVSIALGFLANTTLSPNGNTAGANTTTINSVSGGISGINGQGVGLVASYKNVSTGTTATFDPDPFLTGTSAHSRAYTIQINRSGVSTVGYVTSYTASTPSASITIPAGSLNNNDLLIYACAYDSPDAPNSPTDTSVLTWTDLTGPSVPNAGNDSDSGNVFAGSTTDNRGTGGLGFRISYSTFTGTTGISTTISGLTGGSNTTPAAHMIIILRNATMVTSGNPLVPNYAVWDNGTDTIYGPPNPSPITTNSNGAMVLAIGMVDNIAISNVTDIQAPYGQASTVGIDTAYSMLAKQSYGVQNNGAIIMSAIRIGLGESTSEDPTPFIGGGGNVWASQTIVIGGPGSAQLNGGNLTAGLYGGGGGSRVETTAGSGMAGADGAVRLIWGTGRSYPSLNQGVVPVIDWVP
jgi:hypothetical protein